MDNVEICHCIGVSCDEITSSCKTGSLKTVEEIGDSTGAGMGCGRCHSSIQKILDSLNE